MKSSIFFIALASGLAAATPTGSSRQAEPVAADKTLSVLYLVLANSYKDAPGVSKRDLPADSIPVSVSEDVISSIKARVSRLSRTFSVSFDQS